MYPSSNDGRAYKVVLDGAKQSGKTAILNRISGGEFSEQSTSDGRKQSKDASRPVPYIVPHSFCIEGPRLVHLEIWERLQSTDADLAYENADAIVCVYDVTSKHSYEKAREKLHKIQKRLHKRRVVYGLVGNKSDRVEERVVLFEQALDNAKIDRLDVCLETSAKTSMNVTGLFTVLARKLERAADECETSESDSITVIKKRSTHSLVGKDNEKKEIPIGKTDISSNSKRKGSRAVSSKIKKIRGLFCC